jgi:hypothetical protein
MNKEWKVKESWTTKTESYTINELADATVWKARIKDVPGKTVSVKTAGNL